MTVRTPKKKTPANEYNDIIIVEWSDACSSHGWTEQCSPDDGIASCVSVGRIVHEDKSQVILAATWSDASHNQRIAIPTAWIKSRTKQPTKRAPKK